MNVAAGDLGASAAKKYDCEAWLPGQERYRELTSTLEHDRLPGAPPARRFRPAGGGSPLPVHTLNGTAVAVGRTLLAIMENHQLPDGGFRVPSALHDFGAPRAGAGPRRRNKRSN